MMQTSGPVEHVDWIIIGGGFAGLATAHALGAAGLGRGLVLEREPLCGSHASGRNAALFRLAESDEVIAALAHHARCRLGELETQPGALMNPVGGLTLAAKPEAPALAARAERLRQFGRPVSLLSMPQARARFPELNGFRAEVALWCPDEGVIDIHALLMRYLDLVRSAGFRVRTRARVDELLVHGTRVTGVRVGDRVIHADGVIDATGAWAGRLRPPAPGPFPVRPFRRHLFITGPMPGWTRTSPFVWMTGNEWYLRPEGEGLLASPCDESPSKPGAPAVSPSAALLLAKKLRRCTSTADDLTVRRAWACLRSFAPDRRPLLGPDPVFSGLYHVSGLGGFGATASAAIGELAVALCDGRSPSWIDSRLVAAARVQPGEIQSGLLSR